MWREFEMQVRNSQKVATQVDSGKDHKSILAIISQGIEYESETHIPTLWDYYLLTFEIFCVHPVFTL